MHRTPRASGTFAGKNYFNRILKNVRAFRELQDREGHAKPRVSAWLTGLKETIRELPAFVQVAAEIGVKEVYLQRLVYFDRDTIGKARPDQSLFEQMTQDDAQYLERRTTRSPLGMTFSASGAASEPGMSLKNSEGSSPWSLCRRPWTLMYFTANGRALPCCIAPFSQHGYEHYTLGDATQQTLRDDLERPGLPGFRAALLSDHPPQPAPIADCAGASRPWPMPTAAKAEPSATRSAVVSAVIPCLNEEERHRAAWWRRCWPKGSTR